MFGRVPSVEGWQADPAKRLGWQGWVVRLAAVLVACLLTVGSWLFVLAGAWTGDLITFGVALATPFLLAGGSALAAARTTGATRAFLRVGAWALLAGGVLLMIPVVMGLAAWATGN